QYPAQVERGAGADGVRARRTTVQAIPPCPVGRWAGIAVVAQVARRSEACAIQRSQLSWTAGDCRQEPWRRGEGKLQVGDPTCHAGCSLQSSGAVARAA